MLEVAPVGVELQEAYMCIRMRSPLSLSQKREDTQGDKIPCTWTKGLSTNISNLKKKM